METQKIEDGGVKKKTVLSILLKWVKRLVIAFVIFVITVNVLDRLIPHNLDEILSQKYIHWMEGRYQKAYDEALEKRREMYRADTDGGKTPEETLDLFITALKAGDAEKASKYYVLEKQEEEFAYLKDELKKNGNFEQSIKSIETIRNKGVKMCGVDYNYGLAQGCGFSYSFIATETSTTTNIISGQKIVVVTPKGAKDEIVLSLVENVDSHVWKILY